MKVFPKSGGRRGAAQQGFTLIEIAVALVVIGVLAAITFKSQELIEQYRQSQFVNSARMLQSNLSAYRSTYGRWPGDCNRDGLVDYGFINTSELSDAAYDYGIPTVFSYETYS